MPLLLQLVPVNAFVLPAHQATLRQEELENYYRRWLERDRIYTPEEKSVSSGLTDPGASPFTKPDRLYRIGRPLANNFEDLRTRVDARIRYDPLPFRFGGDWFRAAAESAIVNLTLRLDPKQLDSNRDFFARRLDPSEAIWGPLIRLSSDPLPDINPRMSSNRQGRLAVAWQGFLRKPEAHPQARNHIFLLQLDGDRQTETIQLTDGTQNDWAPSPAIDSQGAVWVAYDTFRNGSFDVCLAQIVGRKVVRPRLPATGVTSESGFFATRPGTGRPRRRRQPDGPPPV